MKPRTLLLSSLSRLTLSLSPSPMPPSSMAGTKVSQPAELRSRLTAGLLLVVVVLLLSGRVVKPLETPTPACDRLEFLHPHLDIDRYNGSYPFVDYKSVLYPITEIVLGHAPSERDYDLLMFWQPVCRAESPEAQAAAWKNLAQEINHRMHTDDSVFKISKILFGDRMGKWMMDPHEALASSSFDEDGEACIYQLYDLLHEHCGESRHYGFKYSMTFTAMCNLGVQKDEFDAAAFQICQGYSYTPNLPPELLP